MEKDGKKRILLRLFDLILKIIQRFHEITSLFESFQRTFSSCRLNSQNKWKIQGNFSCDFILLTKVDR